MPQFKAVEKLDQKEKTSDPERDQTLSTSAQHVKSQQGYHCNGGKSGEKVESQGSTQHG